MEIYDTDKPDDNSTGWECDLKFEPIPIAENQISTYYKESVVNHSGTIEKLITYTDIYYDINLKET